MDSEQKPTGPWRKKLQGHPLPENNPETIAKHAILVLEKALQEDFGVEVHAGVELECSYRIPEALERKLINNQTLQNQQNHDGETAPFVEYNHLHGKRYDNSYLPAADRKVSGDAFDTHEIAINLTQLDITSPNNQPIENQNGDAITHLAVTDSIFPDSRWIAQSYCEVSKDPDGWTQYEHVISHKAPHDKIPFGEGRMLVLAKVTEALRRTIATTSPEQKTFAKDPLHNAWLNRIAHAIIERSTESMSPMGGPQGLHINISLTRNNRNIMRFPEQGDALVPDLCDMLRENDYLLLPSEKSRERHAQRHQDAMVNNCDTYLEITQPAMESNPYYSMMLTLAAVYHSLAQQGFSKETGKFDHPEEMEPAYAAPKNKAEMESFVNTAPGRFFHGYRLLGDLLDTLEPSLGSRFEEAIKQTPPGHEKSPLAAGIVSAQPSAVRSV